MNRSNIAAGLDVCAVRRVDRRRVAATRRRLLSAPEAVQLAELFRLLGDATRARILFALLEAGELCVCDLAATVAVAETSVSHALRLLRAFGIVRARRDGRKIHYRLDDAHVRVLLDLSREHLRHGKAARRRPKGMRARPRRGRGGRGRPGGG